MNALRHVLAARDGDTENGTPAFSGMNSNLVSQKMREAFAYDTPLDEALGHLGDTDFLAFSGAAGSIIKLTLASLTGGLDPNLRIWDPLGNLVDTTSYNGNDVFGRGILCIVSPELNLTETGIYKIGLNDTGWNETGNYRLGVSCLFGDCPSAAPSAVPVPPALWLMGSGILGLGASFRRRIRA